MKATNLFFSMALAATVLLAGCNRGMQGTASNQYPDGHAAVGSGTGTEAGMGSAEGSTAPEGVGAGDVNTTEMGIASNLSTEELEAYTELNDAMEDMVGEVNDLSLTGRIDEDFALIMARHHKSSLRMADIIIDAARDLELQALMRDMVRKQEQEIELLNDFTESNVSQQIGETDTEFLLEPIEAASRELREMTPSGNLDVDFAKMMLSHHKSGRDLAELQVQRGSNTALKTLAQQMIQDQEREMERLTKWISSKQ